ncbi:hypothetical protein ATEG_09073 [Aspergillus terreus NIH2624]|uniref:NADH:flavin oxidoreductase/NADH oxidase family protein n=2 Tax=Aspergillus terreus TaxID=33178 RepID=A0A5M3YNN1_ASPTE|nr:uncharacterized protein ATEG_09073 [Aspergillus terreus NIH2624]EAU30210.1 hypothetical protein ATEG_09073 [Aspergillus terreus NIH2624]KAG2413066.1 hypothetical protein HFD88_010625 [Aspergillus terreus]GES57975.1 hypothetical protein ATETN484_0002015000 [Aspergillus terreus]GFF14933.1 NADH:flavin oxidoreductase/NADH oxidase family protein [Aspergillus terreus]
MSSSKLFEPLRVGQVELQHRVVMAPLTRFRNTEDNLPLPIVTKYYEQRASVPGTLLIAEANQISPAAAGMPHGPAIWNEAHVQAWKKVTDAVHAKGSHIYCQLIALGRAAHGPTLQKYGDYEVSAPSPIPMEKDGVPPKELTEAQIQGFIADFAQAGKNAIAAGFDGVEVHGANGYLVDQFTQDVTNQRTDGWGGSVANRARFAIEVARALVDAVGADRVAFRLSPWNTWQGMKMADPVPQFSYLVEKLKELKLAYLHLVESRVINNIDCEKGEGLEFLLDIWGKTSPVLVAGGYTPENCREVDEQYKNNDVAVVFGRHFISNPDLPFRIKNSIALQKYDRDTFYTPIQEEGYLDYPFSPEFTAAQA